MDKKIVNNDIKFDIRNVKIVPSEIVTSNSRKDYNPFNKDKVLPVIISPMYSCFTLEDKHFNKNFDLDLFGLKIPFCYTRNYNKDKDNEILLKSQNAFYFDSYSLIDFQNEFLKNKKNIDLNKNNRVLIDTANGHLKSLIDSVKKAKDKYGSTLELMVGNIANPLTYKIYAEAGVDYARMSIGNGANCTTSKNSSVFYPMGSLISETKHIKDEYDFNTKIVADGGFSDYSDILTGLALGADYVMIGGIPSKILESDSTPYLFNKIPINNKYIANKLFNYNLPLYKKQVGMSTKFIQKKWKNKELKTSEGIITTNKVNNTLSNWTTDLVHYIRTALSYTDCKTIEEFQNNANLIFVTETVTNILKK